MIQKTTLSSHVLARALRTQQRGFSLLEMMIAILIMSFGVTGAALLTVATVQYNKTTQYQMVAQQIANQLAESMRANTDGFMADSYKKEDAYSSSRAAASVPDCVLEVACTISEIASIDKAKTANTLIQSLPGGDFNVQRSGNRADIWIMWLEPSAASTSFGTVNCRSAAVSGVSPAPRCLYWRAAI